jgi:N6-adenosine-specific RNA methylase IME4
LAPVIKEIRAEKVAAKKEKRAEREQQLGRKLQALPEKSFGVAIEDFEWDHEPWSRKTGVERHPSMHYETAEDAHSPEDIVARCAERFACLADDCVLFKWTTIPHLAIAIRVMELQGFRYVTSLVWNKERPGEARGPGYWFTGEHEIVLVGVRGKVVAPAVARFRSNFSAPVGEHSEKPANIHEIVEFHWPSMPKVEFNARRARPGWTAWGFDAPEHSQANAGDGPALEGEPAGMEAPVSRVADGRTSDEDAPDSHGGASSPIADGGEASRAVDRPAPPAGVVPAECGTVVSDAAPAGRTDDAAPPANRPGRFKFPDDGGIPDFLRFQDQPKKSSRPDLQGEMDVTRRDRAPAEVVDDRLQTRLPLTDDEIELQATLLAIDAGQEVEWSIMRNAIGAGFASATTTSVFVTDEGRAFLALIVGQLPAAKGEGARA